MPKAFGYSLVICKEMAFKRSRGQTQKGGKGLGRQQSDDLSKATGVFEYPSFAPMLLHPLVVIADILGREGIPSRTLSAKMTSGLISSNLFSFWQVLVSLLMKLLLIMLRKTHYNMHYLK